MALREKGKAEMTRRFLYAAGILAVLAYFLYFTRSGLSFYFDNDDMYSIYLGWSKPWGDLFTGLAAFWMTSFRPLGLILYRSLFEVFGFDPLPFRIACFVLEVFNIWLCFRLVRQLSFSERTAAFATLFFAFHSRLMEVWIRTAIVYDILCFTFVYGALSIYVTARQQGKFPGIWRAAAILLCYLFAIDSKEMAVVLPVFLFTYEVIFHGLPWRPRAAWLIVLTGLMAAVFLLTKTHGGSSSMADPSFAPVYTLERFEDRWLGFINHLFLLTEPLKGHSTLYLLGGLLAMAAALRSRILLFAWAVIFFGTLPVAFIPPRGGYVLYLAYFGWTLYAAALLGMLFTFTDRWLPQYKWQFAVILFLFLGWRWGKVNLHDQRLDKQKTWLNDSPHAIQAFADQMRQAHPALPPRTRILLLEDAFQTDEWTPLFIGRLIYDDPELGVDRMKMLDVKPQDWAGYDYVYDYVGGRYVAMKKPKK